MKQSDAAKSYSGLFSQSGEYSTMDETSKVSEIFPENSFFWPFLFLAGYQLMSFTVGAITSRNLGDDLRSETRFIYPLVSIVT
jgi:hypothetical protein